MGPLTRPSPGAQPSDTPSWREVVRRLLVHARCLGASVEEAEDLVHDTLEVVVARPDWLDPDRDALPVLKVALRNRWANRLRSVSVSERAAPRLSLVQEPPATPELPLTHEQARAHRARFLALLEPEERAVFGAWLQQRAGKRDGPACAAGLGMTLAAYEAAKKRLRRRCQAILAELGLDRSELFDPHGGW